VFRLVRFWRSVFKKRKHCGPRPIRVVRPGVCGRRVGCGIASANVIGSSGGIEGLAEMTMFHVFPVLFPDCSHSGLTLTNCECSQCSRFSAGDLLHSNSLVFGISSESRNTGNTRNRIETARFGLFLPLEQTLNPGNTGQTVKPTAWLPLG
jgi:hypothetical protein